MSRRRVRFAVSESLHRGDCSEGILDGELKPLMVSPFGVLAARVVPSGFVEVIMNNFFQAGYFGVDFRLEKQPGLEVAAGFPSGEAFVDVDGAADLNVAVGAGDGVAINAAGGPAFGELEHVEEVAECDVGFDTCPFECEAGCCGIC